MTSRRGPAIHMRSITTIVLAALLPLLFAACTTAPPPQPDPVPEQLSILRKQLLELQVLQNDTRAKLDEQAGIIYTLTVKLSTLEETRPGLSKSPENAKAPATIRNAQVKKIAKKKKPVRRQE